jgi:guanylate kinase
MIEEWLALELESSQANRPLVIEGDGGVGKKTLLVKWFEYHQAIKPKVLRN